MQHYSDYSCKLASYQYRYKIMSISILYIRLSEPTVKLPWFYQSWKYL